MDGFPAPTIDSRKACVGGDVTFLAKVEPYSGPTLNYEWTDKKSRRNNFSLINIEFVNNKNIINYYNL